LAYNGQMTEILSNFEFGDEHFAVRHVELITGEIPGVDWDVYQILNKDGSLDENRDLAILRIQEQTPKE
jgi:hypothetical protein